jgi:hypothetical protein
MVSVTATSVAAPAIFGTAQTTVTGVPAGPTSVTVAPMTAALGPSAQQGFTANVSGNGILNSDVTWSVNQIAGGNSSVGTITTSGLYTAPSNIPVPISVTVAATTVVAPAIFGAASVSLAGTPTITSISPTQGAPGDVIQITGIDFGSLVQTVVFSGPNGLGISMSVNQGSPNSLSVTVPQQATSGPLIVQVSNPDGTITSSNSIAFGRVVDIRIRALRNDLGAAESETFEAVQFGGGAAQPIDWSVDQGNITNEGAYIAPGSLPTDTFAHVSGCIHGTQICDTLLLGLHPFRVDPAAPVVSLGSNINLQGLVAGMPVSATWSQGTGGGIMLPSGQYTASTATADGGSALVSANFQGIQEQASIGVTGGFPGLVNRVCDYIDSTTLNIRRITQPTSIAVSGNFAYVLSPQSDAGPLDQTFYYIDQYDLTDPIHPVWVNAVETAASGALYSSGGVLYEVHPYQTGNEYPSAVAAFDITGSLPILKARQLIPELSEWSFNGGALTGVEQLSYQTNASIQVDQFSLSGGNLAERKIILPPALTGAEVSVASVEATQTRLYITVSNLTSIDSPSIFATYDITTSPATLLGTMSLPALITPGSGFILNSLLYADQRIFDISQDPPVQLGILPEVVTVIGGNGSTVLGASYQNGVDFLDVSDPTDPLAVTSIVDDGIGPGPGVLFGSYFYSAEGIGGLGVYDISVSGGQLFRSQLSSQNPGAYVASGQVANATTLFVAGSAAFSSSVVIFDLQQEPPASIATISIGTVAANAVALLGNTLYVGTDGGLLVYDVSHPSQPNQIGSINTAMNALSVSGNFLFAGTSDGRLVVYNISSPGSPTSVGSMNLPDKAIQIVNNGSLLLIADRTGGLLIFNVSIPTSPVLISQLPVAPAVLGVQADGNLAFLAALESGMVIVDLSNPASPQVISQIGLDSYDPFSPGLSTFQNRASTITIQNKIAYIGEMNFDPADPPQNGGGMVYGFDYRQPSQPRLVSLGDWAVALSGGIASLYATGSNLFISGEFVGLIQVDLSQPRNTINLFYPPKGLRAPFLPPPPIP